MGMPRNRPLKCPQGEKGDKERQFDWSISQTACAGCTLVAQRQVHEASWELYEFLCY